MKKRTKMISKTKISKRARKKTNEELVRTILSVKKNNHEIAQLLSLPTRKQVKKNLYEINEKAEDGQTIIVPGKVLGKGELDKKVKILAFSFSASALEKLDKKGIKCLLISEEIKKGAKLEGNVLK